MGRGTLRGYEAEGSGGYHDREGHRGRRGERREPSLTRDRNKVIARAMGRERDRMEERIICTSLLAEPPARCSAFPRSRPSLSLPCFSRSPHFSATSRAFPRSFLPCLLPWMSQSRSAFYSIPSTSITISGCVDHGSCLSLPSVILFLRPFTPPKVEPSHYSEGNLEPLLWPCHYRKARLP